MREIRPSGSQSGEWKQRHGRILWHWQPKGPATRMADLNPLRHSSTPLIGARPPIRVGRRDQPDFAVENVNQIIKFARTVSVTRSFEQFGV
jgi:hypothetical protein